MSEWRRGWQTVLAAMVAGASGVSLSYYLFSIFIEPIQQETGWSMSEFSRIQMLAGIGSLAAPLVGMLVDRIGLRPVYLFGMAGIALIYLAFAFAPSDLRLFSALVFLLGTVGVITTPLGYSRAVNGWFIENRGFAMAIAATGLALVAIVTPGLVSQLVASNGWRAGYIASAVIALLAGLPAVWWLTRDPPLAVRQAMILPGDEAGNTGWRRSRAFWLMVLCYLGINIPGSAMLSQMVPMLRLEGLSVAQAALGISAFAGGQIVGRLGCGWLIDRYRPGLIAAFFTLLPAIGCVMLWQLEAGFLLALVAVATIGLQQGAEIDLLSWYTARNFGLSRYATIFGWTQAAGWIGTLAGIGLIGAVRDETGGYGAFQLAALFSYLVAAVAIYAVPVRDSGTQYS